MTSGAAMSPYAFAGDDIDTIRKRFFHYVLVFTHKDQCNRWFDVVDGIAQRHGVDKRIDMDFVLGKSTGGVFYLSESSEKPQSRCAPQSIRRSCAAIPRLELSAVAIRNGRSK